MLNRRVLIKDNSVLILDASVFLVRHFNLPVRECVHLVLLQVGLIVLGLVIEESGLDLRAKTIYQLYVEETARASCILPWFLLMFLCDSGFYLPIEQERIQRLYCCEGAARVKNRTDALLVFIAL